MHFVFLQCVCCLGSAGSYCCACLFVFVLFMLLYVCSCCFLLLIGVVYSWLWVPLFCIAFCLLAGVVFRPVLFVVFSCWLGAWVLLLLWFVVVVVVAAVIVVFMLWEDSQYN